MARSSTGRWPTVDKVLLRDGGTADSGNAGQGGGGAAGSVGDQTGNTAKRCKKRRGGLDPRPRGLLHRHNATAIIIVVNAIETPRMREESPDEQRPGFTPAEDWPRRSLFSAPTQPAG